VLAQLFKLLKAINSDAKPWQISLGLALGLVAGLLPVYTPTLLVIVFFACVLRINVASFLLSFSFFSGFAWLFDQSILTAGESILYAAQWQPYFITAYAHDGLLFLQFNHTQVMGAWALSMLLFPLSFLLAQFFILSYRESFLVWIKNTKAIRLLGMNKWYQRAAKAAEIAGELK
jgi:uncharacterized protein (TIGR03546 family)